LTSLVEKQTHEKHVGLNTALYIFYHTNYMYVWVYRIVQPWWESTFTVLCDFVDDSLSRHLLRIF